MGFARQKAILQSMYFSNRVSAGQQLAEQIAPDFSLESCAVVALSDGGVVVGAQIAAALRCVITMLLTEPIHAPGEPEAVASINQDGGFTYNSLYSSGQLEEFNMEYHQVFEEKKREKLSAMHRMLGKDGLIRRDLLRGHTVILVSDGLGAGFSLDAATLYLKTTKIRKLIIATPVASISAVDRMHLLGDQIYCLGVVENFMGTNHYYEDNTLPPHQTIVDTIKGIVNHWNKSSGTKSAAKMPSTSL